MNPPRAYLFLLVFCFVFAVGTSALAQSGPQVLGGDPLPPDPPTSKNDQALGAAGRAVELAAPPEGAEAWPRACSLRFPFCVDALPGTDSARVTSALAGGDRAWSSIVGVLDAPAPDSPYGAADTAWHVYLVDGVEGTATVLANARDPRARFDRASSFALVDRRTPPGCALDLAMARAVARGSLWRAAPATDVGSACAETEMLARLATPCAVADDDVRAFQSRPERSIVATGIGLSEAENPASPSPVRGASLFFDWLDSTFGARPGALVTSLWALAPTRTPTLALRWAGAPTGFDVLRVSLRDALGRGSTLDDVFVRFAVARASLDPPARLAWHVSWPVRARRVAAPEPVAPTGASYVRIDHAGAPSGAKLRLEAQWEEYCRMRWVVLKLDATGHPIGEIPIRSLSSGTTASMTVESLEGVDRVLVVGTNVGSSERAFDPDQGEWEPHGWLLTLEAQ
jgi:hypothetical protein